MAAATSATVRLPKPEVAKMRQQDLRHFFLNEQASCRRLSEVNKLALFLRSTGGRVAGKMEKIKTANELRLSG